MKEMIKTYILDTVRKIAPGFKGSFSVVTSENKVYGDYSTNIAFALAKVLKESPQGIASKLAGKLKKNLGKKDRLEFSKIEAVNGFVNFLLSPECLKHQVRRILEEKNKYGWSEVGQNQKIQVEFISANPTGPLTVGNGRGGFFGDVLANIFASQGFRVAREYYINDRGEQVLALGRSIKLAQGFKVDDEENIYRGGYIKDLAGKISKDLSIAEAGDRAVELILKTYIKPVIDKKLKIKFHKWFSEKSLYKNGAYQKVFKALMETGLAYEKAGATWLATAKIGDSEDRVLIKKDGSETYFLSDILYHWDKFKKRKFGRVINIWGADHHGYAPRLKASLKILDMDPEKLDILITQLVRLVENGKEVKVSKRKGTFVTLEELVDKVGLDAARFFFLALSLDTHMDFNLKLAREKSEKNPVYYIQYSHARLASILRKAKTKPKVPNLALLKGAPELNLIRKFVEYPELLEEITKNYSVHNLTRYAIELAREVNAFYRDVSVLKSKSGLKEARLALVLAAKIVLANLLGLMGIRAPEKM